MLAHNQLHIKISDGGRKIEKLTEPLSSHTVHREKESQRTRRLTSDCQGGCATGRASYGVRRHAVVSPSIIWPHAHDRQVRGDSCPPWIARGAANVQQLPPFVPCQWRKSRKCVNVTGYSHGLRLGASHRGLNRYSWLVCDKPENSQTNYSSLLILMIKLLMMPLSQSNVYPLIR